MYSRFEIKHRSCGDTLVVMHTGRVAPYVLALTGHVERPQALETFARHLEDLAKSARQDLVSAVEARVDAQVRASVGLEPVPPVSKRDVIANVKEMISLSAGDYLGTMSGWQVEVIGIPGKYECDGGIRGTMPVVVTVDETGRATVSG